MGFEMLKNLVFPSIFKHQMSLPDVVSGLLLSEGSDVRVVSGTLKKKGYSLGYNLSFLIMIKRHEFN